jgi:hypothetical protein
MHSLLSKLLTKRGIENIEELDKDEKEWFDQKQRILSQPDEISVEDFKKFCQTQIGIIEDQWKNLDNATLKNERLIILHTVYSTILKVANGSKQERELLEDHLTQLLHA